MSRLKCRLKWFKSEISLKKTNQNKPNKQKKPSPCTPASSPPLGSSGCSRAVCRCDQWGLPASQSLWSLRRSDPSQDRTGWCSSAHCQWPWTCTWSWDQWINSNQWLRRTAFSCIDLSWTHHRVLMTLVIEESRSSLETKLYMMPKKSSALSWPFCFSWLTVYTSVMESTAETRLPPHNHIYCTVLCFGLKHSSLSKRCYERW